MHSLRDLLIFFLRVIEVGYEFVEIKAHLNQDGPNLWWLSKTPDAIQITSRFPISLIVMKPNGR